MEEKRVIISVWKTDDGHIYIHPNEILRAVGKYNDDNLIDDSKRGKLIRLPLSPFDGEYVDLPDEDELEEYKEGLLSRLVNCIANGTSIIGRRNERGPKR